MSWLFASGGQSIGDSSSASVLPVNIQDWFSLGLTGLSSLLSKGLKSLLQHHGSVQFSHSVVSDPHSAFFMVQLSHPQMTTGKTIALTTQTSVSKVVSLLLNRLSSFVIAFLPRSKRLFISWLQTLSVVILEPKKIKSASVSTFSPSICHEVIGPDAMILVFECWVLSQLFHSPPSPSPRACSNSCPLSWWYHPTISSSVITFSSYLQSFPASGSFQMSQLSASGVYL